MSVQKKVELFQHYSWSKCPLLGTQWYPNEHEPSPSTKKSFHWHWLLRAVGVLDPAPVPGGVWLCQSVAADSQPLPRPEGRRLRELSSAQRRCRPHPGALGAAPNLCSHLVGKDTGLSREVTLSPQSQAVAPFSYFVKHWSESIWAAKKQLQFKGFGKILFLIRQFVISIAKCFPSIPWHSSTVWIGFLSTSGRLVLHYVRFNSYHFSRSNTEKCFLWHKREISHLGSWFFVVFNWLLWCNFNLITNFVYERTRRNLIFW